MIPSRILLLTRRFGCNFGSSLQAYAMNRVLAERAESVRVADYDENNASIRWRFRGWFDSFFTFVFRCFPFVRAFQKKYYDYLQIRKTQIKRFQEFEKKHLNLTETRFRNSNHLKKHAAEYDLFVCGSDQIWSPLLWDPVFFLDFAPKKKKIAYAPSFGVAKVETHRREMTELLSGFDFISVREESGIEIVKSLTGKDVPAVVDPSLLLDRKDWEVFAESERSPLPDTPYIACYFLGKRIPYDFLRELRQATGYPIINLMTFRTMNDIEGQPVFPGPDGFVRYISHAAYVCTDSFHATVFSLIFDRDFYTFHRFRDEEKNGQNTRIETLLCTKEAKTRFLYEDAHYQESGFPFSSEARENLRKTILERIKRSELYLNDALNNSPSSHIAYNTNESPHGK